jgi:hypothetical protein
MTIKEPENRITLKEIKAHPWYNQPILSHEEIKEELFWRVKVLEDIKETELLSKKRTCTRKGSMN